MTESEKELKSFETGVKEENEKAGLKLSVQKTKTHHFMAKRWGKSGNSDKFYFPGLQNHCRQ